MLRQSTIKLKYCKITGILAIVIVMLFACHPYAVPVGIMGIVHEANQREIENLRSEIGKVMVYEIQAKVRTSAGVQEKTERVYAKIIGHKEHAGGVIRVFDSVYSNGQKITFSNPQGTILTIPSRPARQLGTSSDGVLDHLIGGYIDGKLIPVKILRSEESMIKYGFLLESYIAPLVEVR